MNIYSLFPFIYVNSQLKSNEAMKLMNTSNEGIIIQDFSRNLVKLQEKLHDFLLIQSVVWDRFGDTAKPSFEGHGAHEFSLNETSCPGL
ncbi:hypothetical protein A1A1_03262 [Planococcus antarcticus DSM 14505]|uniref:LXG domain-containing protein n=1 Tax=Planococcus antarcticus DSM 14505 TaxID=1185653 RepID=A0A1C7DKV8_9BACL|nr:hypothetical protein BBH88_18385 [Planococcus antarcticus DSM 14505]EIM08074.1 hypothetical protein A1A1_03262 [Planococcus antarcticus DSM 14505]